MGVLTGIGGGLIRDVLAGRPTLLMSREIYATPILLGCIAFVLLRGATPAFPYAAGIGFAIIFGVRALAITGTSRCRRGSRIGTRPPDNFLRSPQPYSRSLRKIHSADQVLIARLSAHRIEPW